MPVARRIDNETGATWRSDRHELNRLHSVTVRKSEPHSASGRNVTPSEIDIFRVVDRVGQGRIPDCVVSTLQRNHHATFHVTQ